MTGPEHYLEAERLLRVAGVGGGDDLRDVTIVAAAQVHATLALVASDPERIAQAIERLVFDLEAGDGYTEAIRDAAAVARGQAPSS